MKSDYAAALKALMDMSNKAIKMRVIKAKPVEMADGVAAEVETGVAEGMDSPEKPGEIDAAELEAALAAMGLEKEDDEEQTES